MSFIVLSLIYGGVVQKSRVQVWLYGRGKMRIEGVIIVSLPSGLGVITDTPPLALFCKCKIALQCGLLPACSNERQQWGVNHMGGATCVTNC